uniref:Uncharacterized protein n=1 Tax=Anopheles atroparvus TaxID=41427 RepID=A0A182J9F0_ANOAO
MPVKKQDIQEFYELTLLDETKTVQQKTIETLLIASKWEHDNAVKTNETNRIKQQEYQQQQEELHRQQQHLLQMQILQEDSKLPIIDLPEAKLTLPKVSR